MELIDAINGRRSIRKFETTPLSPDTIESIIQAGMQAPSSKNKQPWRFVVVEGLAKEGMLNAMQSGLEKAAHEVAVPPAYLNGARYTLSIMAQAPVTIFIINPLSEMQNFPADWAARFAEVANIQSVGACIQNMLLAAHDLGVGSLWNCDIYLAYMDMAEWLQTGEQIVAAVSFGLPAESPGARNRKSLADAVTWKKGDSACETP